MAYQHVQADDNDVMDLVDVKDQVIGTINQADARTLLENKAGYIRETVAFIQNKDNKIWTPRRTANKRIAPNGLDFSVAEHVQKGESYEDGIVRGFKEELFLDIDRTKLKFLGRLDPVSHMPYFFTGVFLYPLNNIYEYNKADFTGYEWLTPQEIVKRIDSGEPSKNALKAALEKFIIG